MSFAERVRNACITTALEAHDRAALSGLCQEGAWEAAIDAVRHLDLGPLLSVPEITRNDP